MEELTRRRFLQTVGAIGAAGAAGAASPVAQAAVAVPAASAGHLAAPAAHAFLAPREATWLQAAIDRLIPPDGTGPGALEAGVLGYIDRQLAGAWGAGERLYRSGPWQAGEATQGYQLPFVPAELFRNALRALDADPPLAALAPAARDAALKALEEGDRDLGGVPAKVFFQALLELTIEGYFCDPVYGGNKDMRAWEMIGFPGAYADYYDLVDRHNLELRRRPMSLGEDGRGRIHIQPVAGVRPAAPAPGAPAAGAAR